jgi:hypothetical protein
LVLLAEPFEQVLKVLVPKSFKEVGTHMPHAPPIADIRPYGMACIAAILQLINCCEQTCMPITD